MNSRRHLILQWAVVLGFLVSVPFIRFAIGALPSDDGLRHVAQAISGRPWTDVTFIREDCRMDHSPGWNWLLAEVHRLTGMEQKGLLDLAVYGLFALYAVVGLGISPAPIFWMASIAVIYASGEVAIVGRLLHGRPFALSMAGWLLALHLWTKPRMTRLDLFLTAAICGACAWVHGTWYPWAALGAGLLLARRRRRALVFTAAWAIGTWAGAALTGHPIEFLWNSIRILGRLEGEHRPLSMLQAEVQPWFIRWQTLIPVAALAYLSWKLKSRMVEREKLLLPVLAICAGLGLLNFRMWCDWGLPCLTLLAAYRLKGLTEAINLRPEGWVMSAATAGCGAIWLAGVAMSGTMFYASRSDTWGPDTPAAWLPEPGSVVYNHTIPSFCQTYYNHPDMNWKMAIGFEFTFAPKEEYDTFLLLADSPKKYVDAVVRRMTPRDRILLNMAEPPPNSNVLWFKAGPTTWLGKLKPAQGALPAPG